MRSLIVLVFLTANVYCQSYVEGEGDIEEIEISLDSFNKIQSETSIDIYLKQSNEQKVIIKAQRNISELLNKKVSNNSWKIDFNKGIKTKERIELHIETPNINEIVINGSGIVYSKNILKSESMQLQINGSGDFDIKVHTETLSTKINGSGNIKLIGRAKEHKVVIKGSGDIQAFNLEAENTSVLINGSGDVKVTSPKSLDIEINGSGDVHYSSYVEKLSQKINGSGEVINGD